MMDLNKPQILTHSEKAVNVTLFDCKWIPCSTRVLVSGTHMKGHGVMKIYSMSEDGSLEERTSIERKHTFRCTTFGAASLEDRRPAVGDFDGNVQIWDLEDQTAVWSVSGHSSMVNCIDGLGGGAYGSSHNVGAPEVVTGSRDGTVKVWDPRVKEKPVACMQPSANQPRRDCWSVAFGNASKANERVVAAGFDNGDIKLFDLRTMTVHWETRVPNGVCCLSFDRPDIQMNKLAATCLQGKVHIWDMRTKHPAEGYAEWSKKVEKSSQTVWGGYFLRQNREVFATLGGSGTLSLWRYKYPSSRTKKQGDGLDVGVAGSLEKLQEARISDQPISSLDWSPDKTGLVVATAFDQKIRLVIVTKLSTL